MYIVYVLKSMKNNKRYVGYTKLTIEKRLKQHNSGLNRFAKGNRPFKVLLTEEFNDKSDARKRELFLKSGVGRQYLDKILGVAQLQPEADPPLAEVTCLPAGRER